MELKYLAPPTCASFMKAELFGRLILGPVGSGKTTACVIELLRRAMMQQPAVDGYRYTRFAVVRQTLKQLKDTVLKDCEAWLAGLGSWKVSENTFHVQFNDVRSEWVFIPLEDATDQARLLSMQLTGAWMSEFIEMDFDIVGPLSGRIGRYPSARRGNPTWNGIIGDSNMPTEMTPWHTYLERVAHGDVPDWWRWVQPSGLAPTAENLNFLLQTDATVKLPLDHPVRLAQGRTYYQRYVDMHGADSDWVKRYVYAQYGDDPSGRAVFKATFRSDFHIVPETLTIPGYPIILAQDFGRNPWTLICQIDHKGRLLVHDEVKATNVGLEKHIEQSLRPLLYRKYLGHKFMVVGDPSGMAKGTIAEESCFDALSRLGLPGLPAPTNLIEPRLRAVEAMLGRQTDGGPSLMISRAGCPWLCRAMSGGYRFTMNTKGGLRVVPEKDDKEGFSHVADCLQYACLVVHGGLSGYIWEMLRPPPKPKPPPSYRAWT